MRACVQLVIKDLGLSCAVKSIVDLSQTAKQSHGALQGTDGKNKNA